MVLLVFSYQQVNTFYQFLYFKTHETEIIMEFCVNKDKPELKCDGKCHLADQVEMDNETNLTLKMNTKNRDIPRSKIQLQEELLFVENGFPISLGCMDCKHENYHSYLPLYSEEHDYVLLRPPIS